MNVVSTLYNDRTPVTAPTRTVLFNRVLVCIECAVIHRESVWEAGTRAEQVLPGAVWVPAEKEVGEAQLEYVKVEARVSALE